MKNFIKGMFMALIGFVATTLTDLETFNLAYVIIVTVVFTGGYLVKNWLMPSLTESGKIDLRDFLSGIITAVLMGISQFASTLLTDVEFSWKALGIAAAAAFIGYFSKTLPQKST
jgi:hypothetical protein